MGDMCFIKVVYHRQPDKVMRAINYFSSRPKILGKPLTANTVLFLPEAQIRENQMELEPLVDAKVIAITDEDGKPFLFDKDMLFVTPAEDAELLPSLELLLAEDLAAELPPPPPPPPPPATFLPRENSVALDAEGLLPIDPLGDLMIPDELPPELPLDSPPPPTLEVISRPPAMEDPPELASEVRAANENDRFFDDVRKHVSKRRGARKVRPRE